MKTPTFRFFPISLVFILALSFASPALAHGGEPRIEISSERMNPGGVIEVRGVDFEFEEVAALALIGSELEIPLGEITADTEGVFLQIVTLPVDLKEGTYYFRAVTDDHEVMSPELLIQGSAVMNEAVESQRDEDEPLLAPMPTFVPGVASMQPSHATSTSKPASNWDQGLIITVLTVIGIGLVLGLRRMRRS